MRPLSGNQRFFKTHIDFRGNRGHPIYQSCLYHCFVEKSCNYASVGNVFIPLMQRGWSKFRGDFSVEESKGEFQSAGVVFATYETVSVIFQLHRLSKSRSSVYRPAGYLFIHHLQELAVALRAFKLAEKEFNTFYSAQRVQHLSENPHLVQYVPVNEQFFFSCPG